MDAQDWHGNLLLTRGAGIAAVRTLRRPGVEPRVAVIAALVQGGMKLRIIAVHMGLYMVHGPGFAHAQHHPRKPHPDAD